MKLNRSQRHTAYILILVESEAVLSGIKKNKRVPYYTGGEICGMCEILCNLLTLDNHLFDILEHLNLSELLRKKPIENYVYWFADNESGWERRIELLKQCVKETA